MFPLERHAGPVIEGMDHERSARQGSNQSAARVQVKSAADDHEQKHKQAEDQRVFLNPFLHLSFSPGFTPPRGSAPVGAYFRPGCYKAIQSFRGINRLSVLDSLAVSLSF